VRKGTPGQRGLDLRSTPLVKGTTTATAARPALVTIAKAIIRYLTGLEFTAILLPVEGEPDG